MPTYPWISFNYVNEEATLWLHRSSFNELCRHDGCVHPSIISFVGSRRKAFLLAHILGYTKAFEPHGQVRLMYSKGNSLPTVYIDCELTDKASPSFDPQAVPCTPKPIGWLHADQETASDLPNVFISNVLTPLSNVVCYFAADLDGIRGVSKMLARQAMRPKAHTLPHSALPHILVVVETQKKRFNSVTATKNFRTTIIETIMKLKDQTNYDSAERDLATNFRNIQIFGLQKRDPARRCYEKLEKRLSALAQEIHWGRRTSRHLFAIQHTDILADRMISRFCRDKACFNFVRQSRPENFDDQHFETHLHELLTVMPSQSWLWHVIIPLLASTLFLANYPHGSHSFSPRAIFEEFYAFPCKKVIQMYTTDIEVQKKFVADVVRELEEIFRRYEFDPDTQGPIQQHTKRLTSLWPHISRLKSSKSCFSCLMLTPEKVFQCGHAICNVCVRRFGQPSQYQRHAFQFPECFLCGHVQSAEKVLFQLIPPTAGIRILCLDGGGIRGVIPLMFLENLELELSNLGCPLHEFFDYVCGTSAGGLIAIGIFLMHWTPSECLRRFEQLASETFKVEQQEEKLSWTQRLQRVFQACIRDHRYNLSPIERAFHSTLDTSMKMFNPLQNDTKVAVTATTVRANMPCILSNYNGNPRSEDSNYFHVRAGSHDHEISISDAAACTSAAPFFFKSKDVDNLDTYQDGGLQHNNPAFITSWECANLWPDKCQLFEPTHCHIDQMVSLGTGTSSSSKYRIGPHSPKRERFLQRLVGNFMWHLDGEKQWETFIRCVPLELRPRFHRLNLRFPGPEPALDDVAAIERLKQQAHHFINSDSRSGLVKDSMIGTIFYFELESFSQLEGGAYQCSGTVHCRLPLDDARRKSLYHSLLQSSAFFVVSGRPVTSVQFIPRGLPPFRKHIDFISKDMQQKIDIAIGGITSQTTPISGMPTKLSQLIRARGLNASFGSVDGKNVDRPLPNTPLKRKVDQI